MTLQSPVLCHWDVMVNCLCHKFLFQVSFVRPLFGNACADKWQIHIMKLSITGFLRMLCHVSG